MIHRKVSKHKTLSKGSHRMSCWRKRRYRTEFDAQHVIVTLRRHSAYDGHELRAYECSACDGWHVGHAATLEERTAKENTAMMHRFRKTPPTTYELERIAEAACRMFSGEYRDLQGGIKLPCGPHFLCDNAPEKIHALTEALNAAGYEWETLT